MTDLRQQIAEALAGHAGSKAFLAEGTEWDHARSTWYAHADAVLAVLADSDRTASRQTTGQDDTDEQCHDCEHPRKLHNQRGCNGHWGPEEGCTCPYTNTGHTTCKGATVCGDNDELCDQHEREQAHAEGEHAFCGEECACTCGSAGPEFVPTGHYRDCPQYAEPAPAAGQPAEAQDAAMVCANCGTPVQWIDCPTGGWWAHDTHPSDGHDAYPKPATAVTVEDER